MDDGKNGIRFNFPFHFMALKVLHDPDYRKVWDSTMLASEEIGILNVNNDVGYYASEHSICHFPFLYPYYFSFGLSILFLFL